LRSARTRRSYAGDLLGWRAWLDERGIELLGAGRCERFLPATSSFVADHGLGS
jgi:hypothetical protein